MVVAVTVLHCNIVGKPFSDELTTISAITLRLFSPMYVFPFCKLWYLDHCTPWYYRIHLYHRTTRGISTLTSLESFCLFRLVCSEVAKQSKMPLPRIEPSNNSTPRNNAIFLWLAIIFSVGAADIHQEKTPLWTTLGTSTVLYDSFRFRSTTYTWPKYVGTWPKVTPPSFRPGAYVQQPCCLMWQWR